jgi:hypothetical protein
MNTVKLVIKAFRAVDDAEACYRFVDGHVKVLKIFGITMITSAKVEWMSDPDTYVILVESENGEKVLGGARIQVAGGNYKLPIETAVTELDPSIHNLVKELAPQGTAELCGLWNSREVAGLGIGSIYLGRVGVALTTQLNLSTLFALCAPATVKNCLRVGFQVASNLGNNGTFYYPKDDLIATAMLLTDTGTLSTADPDERENIFKLRKDYEQKVFETTRRDNLEIQYKLKIDI